MAIIDDQVKKPEDYKAPTVQPVTSEVDQETGTVEGRLNSLTEKGSRYTNLASRDAKRNANSRGLVNSTMAGAAGVDAAIRASLPIAQQDATEMNTTRRNNQQVQNQFLENRQSTNLNKESASHESGLARGEMTLGSELRKGEMATESALTNEENTLLNELTMKRDTGLSMLTREEQANLNELEMKRDAASHVLNLERDKLSAGLNQDLARLESTLRESEITLDATLKTALETTLQDARFEDETKLQMLSTINNIIRDSQQQITSIGLSDRTAAQQAAAIARVEENRDAELAVYEDLLAGFSDWEWGTDFTPVRAEAAPPAATTAAPVSTITPNQQSIVNDVGVNWGGGFQ